MPCPGGADPLLARKGLLRRVLRRRLAGVRYLNHVVGRAASTRSALPRRGPVSMLSGRHMVVLAILDAHPKSTAEEIARRLKADVDEMLALLLDLEREGLIQRPA